jgi:hypothetical protein
VNHSTPFVTVRHGRANGAKDEKDAGNGQPMAASDPLNHEGTSPA